MTTVAELVAAAPGPTTGFETQEDHRGLPIRLVVQVADPSKGASVAWHDLTDWFVSAHVERGTDEPHGKFKSSPADFYFAARDDTLSPRNTDNSATFGVHVPFRTGQLIRMAVFTVAAGVVDEWWPLCTKQVESWGDAPLSIGRTVTHKVTSIDLHSRLATHVVPAHLAGDSWASRIASTLVSVGMADWSFGYELYGATTTSGGAPLLSMPAVGEQSAQACIDQATDIADVVWRPLPTGKLLAYPHPEQTWHTTKFAAGATSADATGDAWTNPLLAEYPNGVTFSHRADGTEVPILYEPQGGISFGVHSDDEGVINHVQISDSTGIVYDQNVPASISVFGGIWRSMVATWQVQNDEAADRILSTRSYAHLQATPIRTSWANPGTFPAVALLDHLDPITLRFRSLGDTDDNDRREWGGEGLLRKISHDIEKIGEHHLVWNSTVQVDIDNDSTFESANLLPVTNLAASSITETSFDISWSNPTQPDVEPTITQSRVLEQSTLWYDGNYPSGGLSTVNNLDHSTPYTFQVRLITKADGNVTNASPIRSVTVTTLAPTVPHSPGSGGTGGDTAVVIPPPDGPNCVLEWKLEETSDATANPVVWTVVDSGDQSDLTERPDGSFDLTVDELVFTEGFLYRFCSREVCDGTPGDWLCGEPFVHPGDWTAPCTTPSALSTAPYDDATLKAYVPQVCLGDQIYEAVTDTPATKGHKFTGFIVGGDVNEVALASAGGVVAFGQAYTLWGLGDDPKTLGIRTLFATDETLGVLMSAAGIIVQIVTVGSDRVLRATATLDVGDTVVTATSATPLVAGTVYHVNVTYDPSTGTLKLYHGSTEVASATNGAAANLAQTSDGYFIGAVAGGWSTDFAVWASVLATLPGASGGGGISLPDIGLSALYHAGGVEYAALGYADGATVTTWPCELGLGPDKINSGAPKAVSSSTPWNSQPAVSFPADADHFSFLVSNGTSWSIAFLADVNGTGLVRWLDNSFAGGGRIIVEESSGVWRVFRGSGPRATTLSATAGRHLVVLHGNASNTYLEVDGVAAAVVANAGGNAPAGIRFATGNNGGGKSSPLFGYSSTGDMRTHGNWAAWKAEIASLYGITIA